MKNRKYMFLFLMIFMFVFSLSTVSADDFNTTESGTVSGDIDITTTNPWGEKGAEQQTGELKYDIPSEAKEIKNAKVYVNVYGGSASNDYGANANVTLKTNKSEKQIANEKLWITEGTTDGTIYTVNNHTTKCYSDYQMYYDITDSLKGLNGTSISIKVDTYKIENKTFDGRIKLIALILAYNDGDNDEINYYIDSTQYWTKTTITTQFNTADIGNIKNATLTNIALSSADGSYKLNDNFLGDAENHTSGNYYQYNYWDVTNKITKGQNTILNSTNTGTGTYSSLKNVLTLLKIKTTPKPPETAIQGKVSGDVSITTKNPWNTTGELKYDIPSEAKEIKNAYLYVNVYGGSAKNTNGANANVTLTTKNGENQIAKEFLWIEEGTSDGTIYNVNNHITKCYSDYQMYYDITDSLKGLNGTSISIKVDTYKIENKTFDGRIKLIALILAYNDGDNDEINYWIDSEQKWTKTSITTQFNTTTIENIKNATLTNIALSSADGSYKLNDNFLGDAENHTSGNYYQYNYWDVTNKITKGQNTILNSTNTGTGTYSSLKNVLTLLKIKTTPKPTNKTNDTPTEPSKPPAKVTTKKVASKITAKKTITFKAKTKVKKYKITLKAGKKAIKQVYVTLTIKGKNYKVRTDKKGKATFKIKKLTKKGKYKAKIKFAGNKSYKGFTKKVKIVVK